MAGSSLAARMDLVRAWEAVATACCCEDMACYCAMAGRAVGSHVLDSKAVAAVAVVDTEVDGLVDELVDEQTEVEGEVVTEVEGVEEGRSAIVLAASCLDY